MNLLKKATSVLCSIPEHKEVDQKIIHLCIDQKCQISKKSLCGLCLGEQHFGHKSINLSSLDTLIKNEWSRELQQYNQKNKDLTDCIQISIAAILNKIKFLQEQIQKFINQQIQESKVCILKRKYIDQQNLNEKDFEQLAKDISDVIFYKEGIPDFKPIDYEPSDKFQSLASRLVFDAALFCRDITLVSKANIIHQSFTEQVQEVLYQIQNLTNLIERPLSQIVQSKRIFGNDKSDTQSNQKLDFDQYSQIGGQTQFCIQKQVKLKSLEMRGFVKIYDEFFNKPFTQTHIELIKLKCNSQSQICIGGVSIQEPDQFILCATDYAYEFYTETQNLNLARKSRNGEVYWYYVRNRCIGFSPMSKIDLKYPDVDNEEGDFRFSLWLFHGQGGYRIGRLESLEQSVDYKFQYCHDDFKETPIYHLAFLESQNQFGLQKQIVQQREIEQPLNFNKLTRANSCKILKPLFQVVFDPMEIEEEERNIQELIASQPSIINVASQVDLDLYFQKINIKLGKEYMKNNYLRNCYLDIFEKDSIQRKQCSTTELLINLFKTSYTEFMNKQIDNIGIIKLFIEDNIDAFITGSLIPPQQVWHDYKILILAIIIKIMRMKSITGQLIYECMVAHLYSKLGCIFKNEAPSIPEFKDYFEWNFWNSDRNIQLEINNLTEEEQRQLRIVSIIRKYAFLFWSLLWIDPNQILNLNPDLQQFREQQKIPAYRYLNKDRQMFASLILKFIQCNTFAFVPALNALFDVVQDKKILLPIFNKFQDQLNNEGLLESLLDQLGPLREQAYNEFFVQPQVHDKGLVRIVQGKLKLLKDEPSQTENDFYAKLFLNDQRPTFYQD
ncbi:unnamed protein product [Paramecium pentaurelia]|uniref:Uncharacterized protein n=1 Tax=Paramecium pentaurelia TaxID=43138 RepID=A0A8S1RWY8_9CILI|nr:unnamed protein product [Paramecium pentaurelia]